MKKEASQLADCLSKRVDSFDFMGIAHQGLISRSKFFRYKLETLKLSTNSSRIEVCLKRIFFRKMRNLQVQRLFRTFLAYEATAKNRGPNETHWSNADSTLVNDFISFLRDEVSHRCKACSERPSQRFVNCFVTNIYSPNYLLAGIDLMLFVGANPNEAIDESGNTLLHVIAKNIRLVNLNSAVPIAKLLIKKGFNVNRVNNQNQIVLQLVSRYRLRPALRQFLLTKNPRFQVQSLKCLSAMAVSQEDFDVISTSHASTDRCASEIPLKLVEFIERNGKINCIKNLL